MVRPCCREIPHLKEAYEALKGRGFEIYAVSIDGDTERWRQFVAENGLAWTNVISRGSGKESPAAAMYGIRFIPSISCRARRHDRGEKRARQPAAGAIGETDETTVVYKLLIIRPMAPHARPDYLFR